MVGRLPIIYDLARFLIDLWAVFLSGGVVVDDSGWSRLRRRSVRADTVYDPRILRANRKLFVRFTTSHAPGRASK